MSITLTQVDDGLEQLLARRAAASGKSVEEYVVGLLREAANRAEADASTRVEAIRQAWVAAPQAMREARERALAGLAGTWTPEEAEEFDRSLAEQRQIDWEMWK